MMRFPLIFLNEIAIIVLLVGGFKVPIRYSPWFDQILSLVFNLALELIVGLKQQLELSQL